MDNLVEGIQYKEMTDMIHNTLFVDEFSSKIGEDSDISVLSFYVYNDQVASDLEQWFEKGYRFVIDADRSPGEVKPNRYIVYVEIARSMYLVSQIKEILDDLETLTEYTLMDWDITFKDTTLTYDEARLKKLIYLTPMAYKMDHEKELNEMRTAANLPTKRILPERDPDLDVIRVQAGIL